MHGGRIVQELHPQPVDAVPETQPPTTTVAA